MNVVGIVISLTLTALGTPQKDDRELVVGMWKIDQKFGLALEAIKYEKPLDWIITFTKDGKYVWAQYDPYIEGVGRRHRDTKGTFIVDGYENRLILKSTEITGQRIAIECILSENRKSFVIPAGEKGYNVYQDRRIKFLKVEPKREPEKDPEKQGTTGGG